MTITLSSFIRVTCWQLMTMSKMNEQKIQQAEVELTTHATATIDTSVHTRPQEYVLGHTYVYSNIMRVIFFVLVLNFSNHVMTICFVTPHCQMTGRHAGQAPGYIYMDHDNTSSNTAHGQLYMRCGQEKHTCNYSRHIQWSICKGLRPCLKF